MDLRKFASIAERDVDLLLVEEFSVNPRFTEWFVAQVSGTAPAEFSQADCWHSVTDGSLGESDLIVRVADDLAVLIENKIGAAAQPDQAARYRERGLKGVREGYWKRFTTCMVAPAAYLESNREAGEYDAAISYETLRDWFQAAGSQRASYKASLLTEAIEQNRRGYSPTRDEHVTATWAGYWSLANTDFLELEMQRPGPKRAQSDWPHFGPSGIPSNLVIAHKWAKAASIYRSPEPRRPSARLPHGSKITT